MKKYFFGILAVAFALSLSAFTKPKATTTDNYIFSYVKSTFAQADVQSPSVASWSYGTNIGTDNGTTIACLGSSKACEIVVTQDQVEDDPNVGGTQMRLKASAVTITATPATGDAHLFNGTGYNLVNFANKE